MGHRIFGRLPKSQKWQAVVSLLEAPELDPAAVGAATLMAAEDRLIALRGDPSLTYCLWLLTRLASAARGPDFQTDLAQLGVPVRADESALAFVARITDRTREELARYPESGPFGELASLALRRALTETVGIEGRSLFGSSVEDLERSFRRHSSAVQFGEQTTRFFADFAARTLRFYVERELANSLTPGGGLATIADTREFAEALDTHVRQSARIVEDFAAGWFAKYHWESQGALSREEVTRFVAHALRKLRAELRVGAS